METCSMCRKEVDVLFDVLPNGKSICPECAKRVEDFLESNDKKVVRESANYIYTCAKEAADPEMGNYLMSILDDNASAAEEIKQAEEAEKKEEEQRKPVDFSKQADYFEEKRETVQAETGNGFGSGFMKFVAWFLWIGGLIFAITISRETKRVETYL